MPLHHCNTYSLIENQTFQEITQKQIKNKINLSLNQLINQSIKNLLKIN